MRKLLQKKSFYLILASALILICLAVFLMFGRNYTAKVSLSNYADASEFDINNAKAYSDDPSVAEAGSFYVKDDQIYVEVLPVSPGRTFIAIVSNEHHIGFRVYVHPLGQITKEYYFGDFTGSFIIPFSFIIFLICAFIGSLMKYRSQMSRCMYRYENITTLGMTIFLGFLVFQQIFLLLRPKDGLYMMMYNLNGSAQALSIYLFPAAFIVSVMVMISNIRLMIKEGFTIRNGLGTLLGAFICFLTFLPDKLYWFMMTHNYMDIGRETGPGRHIMMFTESFLSGTLAYVECILIATIIIALKAARHVPAFDKDYIIIHGCQIRKDGGLTKLLQGRADRALEFARMQKEATGKDIIFVPSGGKGSDEVISEAEAIKRYLVENGIPENRIVDEDKSVSTLENLKLSAELIRQHSAGSDPKIAFATTNYHVFRAGMYASGLGMDLEGIGSKTKRYFWVNAFVREFIATLYSQRKHTLKMIALIFVLVLIMVLLMYWGINI